jgi:hypothetical protein
MGRRTRLPGSGPALRLVLLLLLLLGQPGGLCAALCARDRPDAAETHQGRHATHHAGGPCHRLSDRASQVHELLDAIVLALTPRTSAAPAPRFEERSGPLPSPLPYPTHPLIPEPPPPRA